MIEVGDLRIDVAERIVTRDGERVKLSPHEFDLLRVLAQNQGKLLTHRMLLREVWGPAYQVEAHYLHVYVSHLRRKIEPDPSSPRYLLTEPGAGYRLVDPARILSKPLRRALRGLEARVDAAPSYRRAAWQIVAPNPRAWLERRRARRRGGRLDRATASSRAIRGASPS